jgi:amino-acid N-acetyltransferase
MKLESPVGAAPRANARRPKVTLRTATRKDVRRIHELIVAHLQEGHLLPREIGELTTHAGRFIVATDGRGSIVACGELAPLSHSLAEVRSLVVSARHRGAGVGQRLVQDLRYRARVAGYDVLCAFTHQPAYFARLGFSIIPHTWLPEKIFADCQSCPMFRRCGQYAMLVPLEPLKQARPAPLRSGELRRGSPKPSAEAADHSLHV